MTQLTLTTNSEVDPTATDKLGSLHKEWCAGLEGEKLFDYLLNSMLYLKTNDLQGWMEKFQPVTATLPIKKKRLRQTPVAAPVIPLPPCVGCRSEEVIDDVMEGQYVCTQCGLIQQLGVFTGGPAHCSFDRLVNTSRVHIHRYSRVVHFRTTIRMMQGDSCPVMEPGLLSRMQVEFDGIGNGRNSIDKVSLVLRRMGLSRKYRRHRWMIASKLSDITLPFFDGDVLMKMFKMFRRLEYYWGFYKNEITPGRVVFFSYRFVFFQFCHALGRPDMTGPHHLLKNEKLSRFQFESYARASKYTGFPVFDPLIKS
jgi:hypothetical protein